jgi:outer membrane protein insertion porin family
MKPNATHYILLVFSMVALFSCRVTVVKHSKPGQPFFFENTININGDPEKTDKATLKSKLEGQIEDSASAKTASKLPWPKFPFVIPVPVLDRPLRFDSLAVAASAVNMKNLMNSLGYRRSRITYDSTLTVVKEQQRVKVRYEVTPGKLYRIDSVAYQFIDSAIGMTDSTMQKLVLAARAGSFLKKGDPFDYNSVDQELNRIITLFQNHGYYKFTRDEIIADADSSYFELIDPTLDPFEYVQRLAAVENKKKNPTVDIYIRLRPPKDSTRFIPYRVGHFTVIPDLPEDGRLNGRDTAVEWRRGIRIVTFDHTFDPDFIARNVDLKPGSIHTVNDYSQTLNNFNKLGVWQNINITSKVVDSLRQVNYLMQLIPSKRRYFSVDFEGSSLLNAAQLSQVGGGKVGLAFNFTLKNRNIGHKAIQLENNLRTGIEFNDFSKILSTEFTLTNRLNIPWIVMPVNERFKKKFRNGRTIVSADLSLIDRFQYFKLQTINLFMGYEWKPKNNVTVQFKPLNLEYTRVNPDLLFYQSIKDFPLLGYTYNDGLIIGMIGSYNATFNPVNAKHVNMLRIFAEESGLVSGALFKGFTAKGKILENLFRFIKFDVDYRHYINFKSGSLIFHAFAGAGFALETESRKGQVTLPFFKSYFAGGPLSMRGWQLRKLGIGSNLFYDTVLNGKFSDKYADVKLEASSEYRFNMFQVFGFWLRGAAFVDAGNIWFRNTLGGSLPNADLTLGRFYKDLAVDAGMGVRIDIKYFLLRFDFGFPIKDPRYGPYNTAPGTERFYSTSEYGWFVKNVWNRPTFQFAIGYPF